MTARYVHPEALVLKFSESPAICSASSEKDVVPSIILDNTDPMIEL